MGLWVGSYEAKGGEGLYPLIEDDGGLVAGEPERGIANASFAVWSARYEVAYFVDELDQGRIVACHKAQESWRKIGDVRSGGALPCYLSLSSDGRWLACANYGDGRLCVFRLDPRDGALLEMTGSFQPSGSGVDPQRQEGPHAHCVVFADGDRALYHVDLGLDCVFRHEVKEGRIVASDPVFRPEPGAGPRHLVLHPDGIHALLICELSAQLLLLRGEGEALVCLQTVSTTPEATGATNLGGHLVIDDGGDVLVTNRGHDSLVRFALTDGKLELVEWCFTGGSSPRHLALRGKTAFVAHEEGGGVTRVEGSHTAQQIAEIPGAAFILDLPSTEP